jgi:hypothetical protein
MLIHWASSQQFNNWHKKTLGLGHKSTEPRLNPRVCHADGKVAAMFTPGDYFQGHENPEPMFSEVKLSGGQLAMGSVQ